MAQCITVYDTSSEKLNVVTRTQIEEGERKFNHL